jgi:hypothetical protein
VKAAVVVLAALVSAVAASAGEPVGRVIADGTTSKGGDAAVIWNTQTQVVEGFALDWGCKSVANGKPAYEIVTHKGYGRIPASHKLSLNVLVPYTKLTSPKVLGKAKVALTAALAWGPVTTTTTQRATAKGTVTVKTGPCSSGTLTYSGHNH